jgi:hypothetical protein
MTPSADSAPSALAPNQATPAMRQYFEAKRQYRDAIVFFRMGDFYENSHPLDLKVTHPESGLISQ